MTIANRNRKIAFLMIFIALIAVATALAPRIAQDPAYHLFADTRTLYGVPRFGDVISNLAFVLVGLAGLWRTNPERAIGDSASPSDILPYRVFYAAVVLIGLGSAYYHWEPGTGRLFWDRLPMTAAFMAFFAAIVADRVDRRAGVVWVLPVALILGAGSVVYWSWSESIGRGDLRPYALIQFGPMLLLPLTCALFRDWRLTDGRYIVAIFLTYGLAILVARFDHEILKLTAGWISGHSVKHLMAALACAIPLAMLRAGR